MVATFVEHGGSTKPKLGQLTVCWAPDERSALDTAMRWWPTAAVKGELMQELPLPRHFEQATEMVTRGQLKEVIVCGPDPSRYLEAIVRTRSPAMTTSSSIRSDPIRTRV
jgi:hypothetical protein